MIGGFTYNLKPDPIFKDFPGYDTVLLSHLIAFGSCLFAVILIVLFYREGPDFNQVTTRIKHAQQKQHSALEQVETLQVDDQVFNETPEAAAAAAIEMAETVDKDIKPLPSFHPHTSSAFSGAGLPPPVTLRGRLISSYGPNSLVTFTDEPTLYEIFKSHLSTAEVAAAAAAAAAEGERQSPALLPR